MEFALSITAFHIVKHVALVVEMASLFLTDNVFLLIPIALLIATMESASLANKDLVLTPI